MLTEIRDHSLLIAIELVTDEQNLSRPLFPNLLKEPMLFRLIRKWILEGKRASERIDEAVSEMGVPRVR